MKKRVANRLLFPHKGGEKMKIRKGERTDRLRRRPNKVRYFYLAVSNSSLHTGISHGGIAYVAKNHQVKEIYFADLLNLTITRVDETVENFMNRWRLHYNEPAWDYARDIEEGIPAPNFKEEEE